MKPFKSNSVIIDAYQQKRNTNNVSNTREAHLFHYAAKSVKYDLSFISKRISHQMFIALHFSIFVPEFEPAFDKADCGVSHHTNEHQ